MSGWPRSRKRLLLAAMLLPWALVVAFCALLGMAFDDPATPAVGYALACWLAAFGLAWGCATACIADAARGRVASSHRPGWVVALLFAPMPAGPAYWWLHVRPEPGEPHGLRTLRPAWAWSPRAKAATGAGTAFVVAFFVASVAWMASFVLDPDGGGELGQLVFGLFGGWTLVAVAVLGLFFLDAVRAGGTHAWLWCALLVLAWVIAAPLYWLLYVRPTAPPDGAA